MFDPRERVGDWFLIVCDNTDQSSCTVEGSTGFEAHQRQRHHQLGGLLHPAIVVHVYCFNFICCLQN